MSVHTQEKLWISLQSINEAKWDEKERCFIFITMDGSKYHSDIFENRITASEWLLKKFGTKGNFKRGVKIVNLTQHVATPEQIKAGVFEPAYKKEVQKLLTFDKIPKFHEIFRRAEALTNIAEKEFGNCIEKKYAMIGGAPFLMSTLESELEKKDITPLYAFSKRISKEDETGRKVSFFKHEGFVSPGNYYA